MTSQDSDDLELRKLVEQLKERCTQQKLPYAAFYFTYLGDHFVKQGMRSRNEQLASLSPFVYAMQ